MYERILVAVDGSPTSAHALTEAARLAKLGGARLRLVNVVEDPAYAVGWGRYPAWCTTDLLQGLKNAGDRILEEARASVDANAAEVDTALVVNIGGRVSDSIIDEAVRWDARLIVVGTHGRRGVSRLFLGSDAERILRSAPVPVLLVRDPKLPTPAGGGLPPGGSTMYERILVAVDGSPTSDRGLEEAVKLAKLSGGRLRLLNVVDNLTFALAVDGYSAAYTGDLLQKLRNAGEQILDTARATVKAAGVEVDTALFEGIAGRVSELVVDEAGRWGADLIVVGTHGRRGVRRLMLGSDAEQILRSAPVPVLLVRSTEAQEGGAADSLPKANIPPAI